MNINNSFLTLSFGQESNKQSSTISPKKTFELPSEIVYEIISFVHPIDHSKLYRTNKMFHAIFLDKTFASSYLYSPHISTKKFVHLATYLGEDLKTLNLSNRPNLVTDDITCISKSCPKIKALEWNDYEIPKEETEIFIKTISDMFPMLESIKFEKLELPISSNDNFEKMDNFFSECFKKIKFIETNNISIDRESKTYEQYYVDTAEALDQLIKTSTVLKKLYILSPEKAIIPLLSHEKCQIEDFGLIFPPFNFWDGRIPHALEILNFLEQKTLSLKKFTMEYTFLYNCVNTGDKERQNILDILETITSYKSFKTLKYLDLSTKARDFTNNFFDVNGKKMLEILQAKLSLLETLIIDNVQGIEDNFVATLCENLGYLPSLKTLSIKNCPSITLNAIKTLLELRPSLTISFSNRYNLNYPVVIDSSQDFYGNFYDL